MSSLPTFPKVIVTLQNDNPQSSDRGPRPIGNILSRVLSFADIELPVGPRQGNTQSQAEVAQGCTSAPQIREMFDAGRVEDALREARNLYGLRSKYFTQDSETSITALASLLEYATLSRTPVTDLHERVFDLEKHWMVIDPSSEEQVADLVATGLPFYMRHALPRACEYSAQAGRKDPSLRDFAEQSLERLFWKYHEFPCDAEGHTMREYAAAAAIRAAAHIASWKVREERPNLKSLDYMAKSFREALADFNAPKAELHYSLFQLAAQRYDEGLIALENIVSSPQGVGIDERIAALDQLTGLYIRLQQFGSARASLTSLQEAIQTDRSNESSSVSRNLRLQTEEVARLKWYEKTLAEKEYRP